MANDHLGTYLNNHLAGSAAALQLMEHLRDAQVNPAATQAIAELRESVGEEVQVLEGLIERLDFMESRPRQATAWVGSKLGALKLWLDDADGGPFWLLEGLEGLAVALAGKHALWQALQTSSESVPELRGLDYGDLIERTETQRQLVEQLRLDAARVAFAGGIAREQT